MGDINKLDYIHVVVMAYKNEENKVELGVWAYKDGEDANKRFHRVMEMHNKYKTAGQTSPLISTETFLVGVYDTFDQSLFLEVGPEETKEN